MLGNFMAAPILNMLTGTTSSHFAGASIYMGLLTGEPTITVNASNIVTAVDYSTYEPSVGLSSYARELIGTYSITFTHLFGESVYYNSADKYYYKANTQQIKFNKASGIWEANGTSNITHFGIFNASQNGSILAWGVLSSTIQVSVNQAANIDIGSAQLRIYAEVSA